MSPEYVAYLQEICRLIDQLRNSRKLTELHLQKRDVSREYPTDLGDLIWASSAEYSNNEFVEGCEGFSEQTLQEDRDFVEQVLDRVRIISSLQVLQIAAVNNDVRLTR